MSPLQSRRLHSSLGQSATRRGRGRRLGWCGDCAPRMTIGQARVPASGRSASVPAHLVPGGDRRSGCWTGHHRPGWTRCRAHGDRRPRSPRRPPRAPADRRSHPRPLTNVVDGQPVGGGTWGR
jgi:hypothetical protein